MQSALTKSEMEKMWQSGPIGILKSHLKNSRGKKLFKIRIVPYKTEELKDHIKTYEVWSKRSDDAVWDAKNAWYKEHYDVNQSGIKASIVV